MNLWTFDKEVYTTLKEDKRRKRIEDGIVDYITYHGANLVMNICDNIKNTVISIH